MVLCGRQIHLCSHDIFVPHKFLQGLQISPVLKHMHREGIPQGVRRQLVLDAGFFTVSVSTTI